MIVNNDTLYHRADMRGWQADEMQWEGESLWRFALKSIAGAVGSEKAIHKDMCEVARHIDNIAAEIELTGDFKGYEL